MIVAEGAAKIAGRKEEDRNHSPGPIGKRSLQESFDRINHRSHQLSALSDQRSAKERF